MLLCPLTHHVSGSLNQLGCAPRHGCCFISEMLRLVYQSCPSGQVSAAQRGAVLTQSCEPAQVQKLQSCISKRFQQRLLAWAERHTSWLLRWSCAPPSRAWLHLPAPPAGAGTSFKMPCPCISFSSAFNNRRAPFTAITSHLHICIVSSMPGKNLGFPT